MFLMALIHREPVNGKEDSPMFLRKDLEK